MQSRLSIISHMKSRRYLRFSTEKFLGHELHDYRPTCTITVPAKFGQVEIDATMRAFDKAGFKVARVIDEPTAAAVAYNLDQNKQGSHVLVYDLGGGTLDASLLYRSLAKINRVLYRSFLLD